MKLHDVRRDNLLSARAKSVANTDREFAEIIGLAPAFYSNIKLGRKKIGAELARTIEAKLNLRPGSLDIPEHVVENVQPMNTSRRVPVISWVQAGAWMEPSESYLFDEAEEWMDCPKTHSANTYALRVRGDSMTAPYGKSYPEGCVIYVDPEKRSPINGERVIAKIDGLSEVTFKTFVEEDGQKFLKPLNPAYPLITESFKIIGTVIGKWEDE